MLCIASQVEFCENEGCSMLAVSVAWDTALHRSFDAAVEVASETLNQVMSTDILVYLVISLEW